MDKKALGNRRLSDVWDSYRDGASDEDRNRLTEYHLPLVKSIALGIKERLPDFIDVGDLIQDGSFGLIEAVKSYDVSLDVGFRTHASSRIKGAIKDGLRRDDYASRGVRRRRNYVEAAEWRLRSADGVAPTDAEILRELGSDEYNEKLSNFAKPRRKNKARAILGSVLLGARNDFVIALEDVVSRGVSSSRKYFDNLCCAVDKLPGYAREVVRKYYWEGLEDKDIAGRFDVDRSRIGQIRREAIVELKEIFGRLEPVAVRI